MIPRAQGEAYRVERLAEAYRQEKTEIANGAAQRIREVFAKYQTSPQDTRSRLYLEALEQCLAKSRKIIVDGSGGHSPAGVSLFGPQ